MITVLSADHGRREWGPGRPIPIWVGWSG